MPQRLTKISIYNRSLGLAACASLESKNKVCLLCEVNPKQIPTFDFICASLESISAIEDTWERSQEDYGIEQYLQCIDYTLWEIVENGNAPIVTKTVDGKETIIPPTSVEEKA
ncbi:hypothetical protein Tco_0034432 [Tanacetum coccineum]